MNRQPIAGLLLTFAISGHAAAPTIWNEYRDLLAKDCPSHHVDWIFFDGYIDLTEGFAQRFPPATSKAVEVIADIPHRCADVMGFTCTMERSLVAYKQLNLLGRFVKFACLKVKCEEPAVCSRVPGAAK